MASRAEYSLVDYPPSGHKITRKPVSSSWSQALPSGDGAIQWHNELPPDKSPHTQRRPSRFWSVLRYWLPELVSSAVSVCALIVLVIVLRVYQGRSLGDLHLAPSLTINGLVALIATINRIALMGPIEAAISQDRWLWFSQQKSMPTPRSRLVDFELADTASRGVWGSLMFLLRGRGHVISYIGAIITILSIAFGTFAQQLLSIEAFPVSGNNTAGQIAGAIPRELTWDGYAAGGQAPLTMKAAVYSGMMTMGIKPVDAVCSTGNCTWPITPSIGACGECKPVSYTKHCNDTSCDFTMSTGTTVTLANLDQEYAEGACWTAVPVSPQQPAVNVTGRQYIAAFDTFGVSYERLSQEGFGNLTSERCSLWWCVNAYSRTSIDGNQTERIVSTTDAATYDRVSFNFSALPPAMNPARGEVYHAADLGNSTLAGTLLSLFAGTGYCAEDTGADETVTNDGADAIWSATSSAGGLEPWIQNLALSINNVIRTYESTYPALNSSHYYGIAYQQGIKVRWPWITLLAAIVASSLVILAYEMVATARSNVFPWKASPLAVLFTDVDDRMKNEVGWQEMTRDKGVVEKVGAMRTALEWTPMGRLRFSGVDGGDDGGLRTRFH